MAVIGVVLLMAALLAIRGRLRKLAFHRAGTEIPGQNEAGTQHDRPPNDD